MTLYLSKYPEWHAGALSIFFEYSKLFLQLFVGTIHRSNQIGHISYRVGVKANPKNHPANRKDALLHCKVVYVSESYCCQSLQRPVKRHHVLLKNIRVQDSLDDHPAVWREVVELCNEEEKATSYVV